MRSPTAYFPPGWSLESPGDRRRAMLPPPRSPEGERGGGGIAQQQAAGLPAGEQKQKKGE